ncbi:MAG: MFS transporter, partial [Gammaproteobacteria bacterium]|nr:MFS transporter [Gammaproteobacteria bacterium]
MLAIILGSTSMFRWVVLFGVWAAYSAFGLVATSLAPLVPLVEQDLQLSHTAMGSIMGAWQLTYIAAAIPCGLLLDRYPARYTLTLGILLIALSALLRGFATDYTSLLFAVMLFGLGGPHTVLLPWLGDWQTLMIVLSVVVSVVALLWLLIANHSLLLASESRAHASNAPTPERPTRFLLGQRTVQIVLLMSVGVFLFNHGLNNWLPELLKGHGMTLIEAGYWAAIPTVIGILLIALSALLRGFATDYTSLLFAVMLFGLGG